MSKPTLISPDYIKQPWYPLSSRFMWILVAENKDNITWKCKRFNENTSLKILFFCLHNCLIFQDLTNLPLKWPHKTQSTLLVSVSFLKKKNNSSTCSLESSWHQCWRRNWQWQPLANQVTYESCSHQYLRDLKNMNHISKFVDVFKK